MVDRDLSSTDDSDDGAGDDAGAEWSSLREMIGAARASGFDEEPSPRIDALLMAAARAHAPKPRVAWWSRLARWMRPVVMHPALAGAAALVIVGGAAGVMYKRGQLSVGPPKLEQTVVAPPRHPRPDPRVATVDSAKALPAKADAARPPVVLEVPTTTLSGVPPEVMAPELPKPQAGARRQQRDRGGAAPGGPEGVVADGFVAGAGGDQADPLVIAADGESGPGWEAHKNAAPDDDRAGADEDQGEREKLAKAAVGDTSFSARVGGVAPVGATQQRRSEESAPVSPPPPPSAATSSDRPANVRDSSGAGAAVTTGSADRRGDEQRRTQVMRLLEQARRAARSGNCGAVRTTSAKVRKLDAAYHRDVFSRDPDIAKCR